MKKWDINTKRAFLKVSSILTGIDELELECTGLTKEYYDNLMRFTDKGIFYDLINYVTRLNKEDITAIPKILETIMEEKLYKDICQQIIILWYTGSLYFSSHKNLVLSTNSYKEGIVWKVINGHSLGANPTGYGSWEDSPEGLTL